MQDSRIKRLRRQEASTYLMSEWGISRRPSTLAKLAVIGGGPRFESVGRVPLYRASELDAWAQSVMSGLRTSTSDKGDDEGVSETDGKDQC